MFAGRVVPKTSSLSFPTLTAQPKHVDPRKLEEEEEEEAAGEHVKGVCGALPTARTRQLHSL